ncbi:hypothetical protein MSAN_00828400 [Mycena sanguinolenta]|uniref:Uncharacterized protein n=1 Tax=Mycena sanguinolenta TaxID=230812 RepID=A0A8H7DD18_9AGAR|nr:hypothetical protein MSAN_00828400 [Mycena sanguinolenta]
MSATSNVHVQVNEDIFSCVLEHISDARTLHALLAALPKSHPLFHVGLTRLWQLPIHLDSYDAQASAASQKVLDYLLDADVDRLPLAESVRHLVVAVEHEPRIFYQRRRIQPVFTWPEDLVALHARLLDLFPRLVNLESLDYHSFPGADMKSEHVEPLRHLRKLQSFGVDCALRSRDYEIPAGMAPGDLSRQFDAENWEMEPFLSTIGPAMTSLEFRHVNHTFFAALARQTDLFTSYEALEHLKIDITEGVWDWQGGGSPAMGASPEFTFPFLGFPSIKRFDLVVCDQTLSGFHKGPMNMVHSHLLTDLSLDVRHSIFWMAFKWIHLFEHLSPSDFPALSRLEIKDNTRNTTRYRWESKQGEWARPGRAYLGLVSPFLGSIGSGFLPKLSTLWVDEKSLLPPALIPLSEMESILPGWSVHQLLDRAPTSSDEPLDLGPWWEALGAAFEQLESLRVGFGAITHLDAEPILGLCDPTKLTQFGFEWDWKNYGRDEPLSPVLLEHLARFLKLTDVHILFPRPETHLPGIPDPVVSARTVDDVKSIFNCNGSICRVGIGNSVVWERHPSEPSAILLVSDGSVAPNPAVSKFYHAGFMPKPLKPDIDNSDNAIPLRPARGKEIEQLRDLLHRILT